MKKNIIALVTVLTLCSSGMALAAPDQGRGGFVNPSQPTQGGFQGPSMAISTVEQAKQMSDDQHVALRGYIVQSFGDEDYLFKDDSGTINVEIDHKRWHGQVVTPNDLVEIQGKIDKDWSKLEIDVKRIFKVEKTKTN